MITDKQVIEALKTIQEYCKQYSVKKCYFADCVLYDWCQSLAFSGVETSPEDWLIPQLGGGQNE